MRIRLMAVLLPMISCGEPYPKTETLTVVKEIVKEPEYVNVDEKVRPHLVEFLQYCSMTKYADKCKTNMSNILDITLKKVVNSTDTTVVGVCKTYTSGHKRIELSSESYPLESLDFKILVWHELGHCLMELPHVEDRLHVMNPWMMSYYELVENWDRLIKDFLYGETDEKLSSCSLRTKE